MSFPASLSQLSQNIFARGWATYLINWNTVDAFLQSKAGEMSPAEQRKGIVKGLRGTRHPRTLLGQRHTVVKQTQWSGNLSNGESLDWVRNASTHFGGNGSPLWMAAISMQNRANTVLTDSHSSQKTPHIHSASVADSLSAQRQAVNPRPGPTGDCPSSREFVQLTAVLVPW